MKPEMYAINPGSRMLRYIHLVIKIATYNGSLHVTFCFAIFVVKCNAIENMGQDQNYDEKQHNRKIAIHLTKLFVRLSWSRKDVHTMQYTTSLTKAAISPPLNVAIHANPGTWAETWEKRR